LQQSKIQNYTPVINPIIQRNIEERHGYKSTIIASQIPISKWYDVIGEGTIADAILDRIINSSYRLELKGKSLRASIHLDK